MADASAEPLYVETLEARRAVLGNRHPDTLTSLNNLAQLYMSAGTRDRLEQAEPLLKEVSATPPEPPP